MCRYDDDFDWYVDTTDNGARSEATERCEDCGRPIAPGEAHTLFTCIEGGEEDYNPDRYIWAAQAPEHLCDGWGGRRYFDESKPYTRINEDVSDVFEALGFTTDDDVENPAYERPVMHHISCTQCILANEWLVKVCSQNMVQVTVVDLDAHTDEYHPPMLGADFMRLHRWSQRKWTLGTAVVPPAIVAATTRRAIDHALAVGLQDAG